MHVRFCLLFLDAYNACQLRSMTLRKYAMDVVEIDSPRVRRAPSCALGGRTTCLELASADPR